MTICIGIDVHKKKCIATLKSDSQEIVEQTSFYNSSHGIQEFIEHIKLYREIYREIFAIQRHMDEAEQPEPESQRQQQ